MAVRTMRDERIARSMYISDDAAPDVLAASHRLQMRWVHAAPNAAQVIDVEAFRDWPSVEFVCDSVRIALFVAWRLESTIAVRVQTTSPQPAPGERLGRYPALEEFVHIHAASTSTSITAREVALCSTLRGVIELMNGCPSSSPRRDQTKVAGLSRDSASGTRKLT